MAPKKSELVKTVLEYARFEKPAFPVGITYDVAGMTTLYNTLQNLKEDEIPKMYEAYDSGDFAEAVDIATRALRECGAANSVIGECMRSHTVEKNGSDEMASYTRTDETNRIYRECIKLIWSIRSAANRVIRGCKKYNQRPSGDTVSPKEYLVILYNMKPNMSIIRGLKRVYGAIPPMQVSIIASSGPLSMDNGARVLSSREMLDTGKIDPVFIRRRIIPLIDFGDNVIGCFDVRAKSFCKYSISDKSIFGRVPDFISMLIGQ